MMIAAAGKRETAIRRSQTAVIGKRRTLGNGEIGTGKKRILGNREIGTGKKRTLRNREIGTGMKRILGNRGMITGVGRSKENSMLIRGDATILGVAMIVPEEKADDTEIWQRISTICFAWM